MSPAEREARAQELLNQTIQRIAIEYGFTAKQKLVIQMPAENFGTMTSSMWLDPIAGWTPPPDVSYEPKEVNPVGIAEEMAEHVMKGLNGDRG